MAQSWDKNIFDMVKRDRPAVLLKPSPGASYKGLQEKEEERGKLDSHWSTCVS